MAQILERGKIGSLTLKNKMIMAPMGLHAGNLNQRVIDFYKARIDGEIAMIMCNIMITDKFEDTSSSMMLTEENKEAFKELCTYAHERDCKICVQLMPGCGRTGGPSPLYQVPISASACGWLYAPQVPCHELTLEEIKILQTEYRRTAKIALEAGADAIEIHAYGGYLTDQFLTAAWNMRTDEYGGNLTGRAKFLLEMVSIAKEEGGSDFPVIVKYSPCHYMPAEYGFRDMEEGIELSKMMEQAGVDALHVDAGCYENWYYAMPPVYFQEMAPQVLSAKIIKKNVKIPVITHGRLSNLEKAETALEQKICDFVAVGRGLLADPELVRKAKEGHADEICPCISCNEECIGQVCQGNAAGCAVNPFCGYETERKIEIAKQGKKILIVGAGPGGCEAALLAKRAGHQVEIWEKTMEIGGRARSAAMPYMKRDMGELIRYYQTMLAKEQIPVRYGKIADKESVREFTPDAVIWAAGGKTIAPNRIQGINKTHVSPAEYALKNLIYLGEKIVIIGGGLVGIETAVDLTKKGKQIVVIEMQDTILPKPPFTMNATQLQKMFQEAKADVRTNTKVVEIKDKSVIVEGTEGMEEIECDNVLLAMGYAPSLESAKELEDICPVYAIGDSLETRTIGAAVKEAFETVVNL